jgi:hypothetical protein
VRVTLFGAWSNFQKTTAFLGAIAARARPIARRVGGASVDLEKTLHDRRPREQRPLSQRGVAASARPAPPPHGRALRRPDAARHREASPALSGATDARTPRPRAPLVSKEQIIYDLGALAGAVAAGGLFWLFLWWSKRRR